MPATIKPTDLERLLQAGLDADLIDVRTPVEFAGIHVSRFRNVPLGNFNPAGLVAAGVAAPERAVYLFCKSGGRARQAADRLVRAGFTRTVVVEGGLDAWEGAGLPLVRGAVKGISLERQVRIAAGSLVLLGFLLAWVIHPWFLALSVFVGAGLVFAGVTDFCGLGLLLARAPWNGGPDTTSPPRGADTSHPHASERRSDHVQGAR